MLSANRLGNAGTRGSPSRRWVVVARLPHTGRPIHLLYTSTPYAVSAFGRLCLGGQDGYPEPSGPVWNDPACAFGPAHDLGCFRAAQPRRPAQDNHVSPCVCKVANRVSQLLAVMSLQEELFGVVAFLASAGGSPTRGKVSLDVAHQLLGAPRAMRESREEMCGRCWPDRRMALRAWGIHFR